METKTPPARFGRRRFLRSALRWFLTGTGILALTGLYAVAIERFRFVIHEETVSLKRLPPSFDGLRIAHLSDLHLGHYLEADDLQSVWDTIAQWQPDLICFTGDLVDRGTASLQEALPHLTQLQAPLGKWAVLGNHDYRSNEQKVQECLEQAGFQVMNNRSVVLERGKERLCMAGVDDCLQGQPDLLQALRGVEEVCTLLLVHEPDFAEQVPEGAVDLQLSGHSHGGQVRLPFIGHVLTPPMGQAYPDGLVQRSGMEHWVFTNRGIGTTILPIRFLCRPEVAFLTLRSAGSEGS